VTIPSDDFPSCLRDELTKLKKRITDAKNAEAASAAVANATAEKALGAAEAAQRNVTPQAEKALQTAEGLPEYLNPDLLADDSDPFYQVLANPNFKPGWSTNFFIQDISADGKVSFLIVRETAMRFTVNEAKANPAVLIRTQLRSARAGIKNSGNCRQGP